MNEFVQFGIYNFLKVIGLLFVLSGAMGFLRTYLPSKKIVEILTLESGLRGHIKASLLGAATPFSSQSLNLFANFLKEGVPAGLAFSFLLTSPIINEFIVLLMFFFFGWKITLIYILTTIIIGTLVGVVMSKLKFEKYLKNKLKEKEILVEKGKKVKKRLKVGINDGLSVVKKIWFYIFLGMILQVSIQVFLPGEAISSIVDFFGIFGVPVAILLGVPIPGFGAAVIPVAMALFEKGIPLGTTFGFLVALVSLSWPLAKEMEKLMRKKLIFIFFSVIIVAAMAISYLLNFLIF